MSLPADLLASIRASFAAVIETHDHRIVEGQRVVTGELLEVLARHAAQAALSVIAQHEETRSDG